MNETQQIEYYLLNKLPPQEKLLMAARLLVDEELREKTTWQERSYQLVKHYARKKLKAEIENVSALVFTEKKFSGFRKKIFQIFNNYK